MESIETDEVIICGLCDEHLEDENDMINHFFQSLLKKTQI
jgi:hypothetical protein